MLWVGQSTQRVPTTAITQRAEIDLLISSPLLSRALFVIASIFGVDLGVLVE